MRLGLGLAFVLLGGLTLAACPGPTFIVQQYKGPVRERDTIAILRVNGSDSVRLLTLDDEDIAAPIQEDSRLHIEMLPAKHVVTVANAKAPSERYDPLVFQAEANRVYRVAFVDTGARIFEVDRGTDKTLVDVTIVPKREEPPPVTPPPSIAPPEDAGSATELPTVVPSDADAGAP